MATIKDLGSFILYHRKLNSFSSQEFANMLSITVSYLSQLEHGIKKNPNIALLEQIAESLHLDKHEKEQMYDLYATANGILSPDVVEYATSDCVIVQALRIAQKYNASQDDWLDFIQRLKRTGDSNLEKEREDK